MRSKKQRQRPHQQPSPSKKLPYKTPQKNNFSTSWSTLPVLTPSEATDLLRQRRAPSPSPSLSTRSSSPPAPTQTPAKPTSSSTALIKTSPALLVRKTCALFLGPPANLVATMLRIAARLVASGALNLAEPAFHDLFAGNGANTSAAGAIAAGRLGVLRGGILVVFFFFPRVLFCFSHWSLARSFASVTIPIYSVVSFFFSSCFHHSESL